MGDVETNKNDERPTEPGIGFYDQWVKGIEADLNHHSPTIRTRGFLKQFTTKGVIYAFCITPVVLIVQGVSMLTPLHIFTSPWHEIPIVIGSVTMLLLTTTLSQWLIQDGD